MKPNHSLALIVAYYLSKFDAVAYSNLGWSSQNTAHEEIGRLLGVKPNSVKNMRDEFDPLHNNPRVGWYQRPLRPSRAKVLELFQQMAEEELRDVVTEILNNPRFSETEDFADVIGPIFAREKARAGRAVYIVRGPTARGAEQAFIDFYGATAEPLAGNLIDTRDKGCGYDFEIEAASQCLQIEVKGLDADSGGVLFTSKEWETARLKGDSYYLAIVRNVSSAPTIQLIRNPALELTAQRTVFTSVQVRWAVTASALRVRHTAIA